MKETREDKLERRDRINKIREVFMPPGRGISPGREHGERFFGPGTRLDWNRLNELQYRYPIRFPPEWDNKTKWRPDDGWPPSSFYNNFLYFMETPKFKNAAGNVIRRYLLKQAQGDADYFGQGGKGDLGRKIIRPVTPTETQTKNYIRFWHWQPWWRVDRYEELTPDEARNDLQFEMYEFHRDLKETPALYQKWVEKRREVREDRPIPSLPIGPPVKKFYRKKIRAFWPSPLNLRVIELLADDDEQLKRAWSMNELLRQTIRRNKVLSKECTVKFIRSDLKKLVWTYRVTCRDGEPSGWLCRIKILPDYKGVSQKPDDILGKDFGDLHVGVKCTCPAFKFWGPSLNSWNQGYHYGPREDDGSAPRVNVRHKLPLDGPVRRALLCKHLCAAATDWVDRVLTEEEV